MEVLIIQKEAFEEMAAKFSRFTERMDAILAHLADAARQRHAGLFADKPQGVLPTGGCDAHRQASGEQT